MAGILESLFDGGGWQQVLGISPANAAPAPPTPPSPPPDFMQNAPRSFSPNSAMGTLSFSDRAQPVERAINEGVFDPQGANYTDFKPMPAGMTQRDTPFPVPGDSPPPPYPAPQANGPQPLSTPVTMPAANGGGSPPVSEAQQYPMPAAGVPGRRPVVTMPLPSSTMPNSGEETIPGGAPMGIGGQTPPMPPPLNGPPSSAGGNLMNALGIGTPEGRVSGLAGIGRGLSAVGAMRSGAPAGAAFATGMGGGIQGQQARQREQMEDVLKAKKEAFTENLQTKNYDINKLNAAIRQRQQEMQIPWWQARTEVLQAQKGQSASKIAWQLSEPGRYHMVDNEVASERKGLEALYRDELKQAATDPEASEKIRKIIRGETERIKAEKYKLYGLDPAKRDAVIKRGFEGTEDQIKYLPPGTRFWDSKAGVTRVRGTDKDNTPIGADLATAAAMPPAASASSPSEVD